MTKNFWNLPISLQIVRNKWIRIRSSSTKNSVKKENLMITSIYSAAEFRYFHESVKSCKKHQPHAAAFISILVAKIQFFC